MPMNNDEAMIHACLKHSYLSFCVILEVLEAYRQFKDKANEDGFKTFILKFDNCYEKVKI